MSAYQWACELERASDVLRVLSSVGQEPTLAQVTWCSECRHELDLAQHPRGMFNWVVPVQARKKANL